uniref:Uncharacterized protein n=2 Tax=Opuntia streptacantha TaxID=393608 RepID=A0A7C9FEA1_OPUST
MLNTILKTKNEPPTLYMISFINYPNSRVRSTNTSQYFHPAYLQCFISITTILLITLFVSAHTKPSIQLGSPKSLMHFLVYTCQHQLKFLVFPGARISNQHCIVFLGPYYILPNDLRTRSSRFFFGAFRRTGDPQNCARLISHIPTSSINPRYAHKT